MSCIRTPQNNHYINKIASSNIIHIFIEMLQLNRCRHISDTIGHDIEPTSVESYCTSPINLENVAKFTQRNFDGISKEKYRKSILL